MQKKRFIPNLFFVIAILAVVGLAYYAREKNAADSEMSFKVSSEAPVEHSTSTAALDAQSRSIDNVEEPPPAEIADKDLEPLKQWVRDEAKSLNETGAHLKAKDAVIIEKVRTFGARQLAHLQKIAEDTTAPMNERILSTYMLSKSNASTEHFVDAATRDSAIERGEAHSEAELRAAQDRALKIMSVDSIAASKDPIAERLAALQTVINKSSDDLVKEYAQQKLNQLKK